MTGNGAGNGESGGEGWRKFTYSARDGLVLAGRKYGWERRSAPVVVCLAGLTRNSADFHELALYLSRETKPAFRVLCLDYRGRGMSQRDRNWHNYHVLTEADDVLNGLVAAGVDRASFVGTSRGGLIIFALTAIRPGVIEKVVLNDIGPQIEARGLVRIKNYLDNSVEFRSLEEAGRMLKKIGEGQFPDWDLQMWISQAERILETRDGRLVPRYDPRLTRTLAQLNLDDPLPQMWPQFDALRRLPVMAIRGENSDVLSAETLERMQARHYGLETLTVSGQGHAPDVGARDISAEIAEFLVSAEAPALSETAY